MKYARSIYALAAALILNAAPLFSQDAPLDRAIAQFYAGEWEQSIGVLNQLLAKGALSPDERSTARKFVALGYILLGRDDDAVGVYKQIVRDDPAFDMEALAIEGGETPGAAVRFFGQAILEVRQEEMRAREAQLARTSRRGALLRSAVVPGWGQRYQGYRGRSFVMLGATAAAAVYAISAESSYQTAKDDYEGARLGADFEDLYDEYTRTSDQADVALGILGVAWLFNVLDTAFQGPNIERSSGGLFLRNGLGEEGMRLIYAVSF